MQTISTNRLLRLPEVINRTGLSRSVIYERIRQGQFPGQISLGKRAVAWEEGKIDQWIAAMIQAAGH